MAQGKSRESYESHPTCVSPLWHHTTNIITLNMRPPSQQSANYNTLETFMAAHSPRKVGQSKQNYILKPLSLDKNKISSAGISKLLDNQYNSSGSPSPSVSSKDLISSLTCTSRSSSANGGKTSPTNHKRLSSNGEHLQASVPMLDLSKCRISNEDIVVKSSSTISSFRPGGYRIPKTPKPPVYSSTGTDMPELVAMGTMALTTHKQIAPPRPVPRFKSRLVTSNKGVDNYRYVDPMAGASPSFQCRVTEIAQLEIETVRQEKQRKTKKRSSNNS